MPIEVNRDPGVIWVHVLHLSDPERTRREVGSLAELSVRAFGTPEVIARYEATRDTIDVTAIDPTELEP